MQVFQNIFQRYLQFLFYKNYCPSKSFIKVLTSFYSVILNCMNSLQPSVLSFKTFISLGLGIWLKWQGACLANERSSNHLSPKKKEKNQNLYQFDEQSMSSIGALLAFQFPAMSNFLKQKCLLVFCFFSCDLSVNSECSPFLYPLCQNCISSSH